MDEENVLCTCNYAATRKKEIMPFMTTWMKWEATILSEIKQTEKEEYCVILLEPKKL